MPANIATPLHEREDSLEEEGLKKRTGVFLENPWVEVAICLLIIADVILVTIELMIDHNYACINGNVVAESPEGVVEAYPIKEGFLFLQTLTTGAWGHGLSAAPVESIVKGRVLKGAMRITGETEPVLPFHAESQVKLSSNATSQMEPKEAGTSAKASKTRAQATIEPTANNSHTPKPVANDSHTPMQMANDSRTPKRMANDSRAPKPMTNDSHTAQPSVPHTGERKIVLQEPKHKEVHEHGKGEHGHAKGEHGHVEGGHGHSDHGGGHGHGEGAGGHGHGEGAHAHGHGHGHGAQALVCETKYGHTAHHIMHTCHTLSILILCVFLVELLLKLWISPKHFCADWLHLLDLFVVVTSLVIDIYISYLIEERRAGSGEALEAATIATLLVILRLWRVVRIAHGFNEIRNMELERRHKEMEDLEERKEAEKKKLEDVIKKHGLEAEVEAA